MTKTIQPAFIRPPYDALTIGLHWTTLALVVGQFATALSIDHAPDADTAHLLLTTIARPASSCGSSSRCG